jgi:acetylornithine deacetylase
VDEEFAGGNGTLAARLRGHNTDLAVIAEPTCMQLGIACFGAFLGALTVTGQAGMPYAGKELTNPMFGAARVVQLLAEFQEIWRAENQHPLFAQPGKELNVLPWNIDSSGPGEFTQLGTPLQVKVRWVIWGHPGQEEEAFYKRFQAYWDEKKESEPALAPFDLSIEREYHYVRPWETPADCDAVQAVADAVEKCGAKVDICGMQFSSDFALYGEVGGMPSVLLGPTGDNLHAPDENVLVADILKLTEIYASLISEWCA